MQLTFGDAEDLGQRKRTRREVFLAEMVRARKNLVNPRRKPLSTSPVRAHAPGDRAAAIARARLVGTGPSR